MAQVIVDHNGMCDGHFFKAGKSVELPETVISALGKSVKRLETAARKSEETKEAKKTMNKMVQKADSTTK